MAKSHEEIIRGMWPDEELRYPESEEYKKFADLHVQAAGGQIFHVHKCIILPGTDFAGALLEEGVDGVIQLEQSEAGLEQLLGHFYGFEYAWMDSITYGIRDHDDLEANVAVEVWIAAQKYGIQTLCDAVEWHLHDRLADDLGDYSCKWVTAILPVYEAIEREHVNFRVPVLDDVLEMLAKNFDNIMSDDLQCYTLRKSPHLMQQVIERVRGS